jgi:hypothetical protein
MKLLFGLVGGKRRFLVEKWKIHFRNTANTFERWSETAEIDLMSFSDCQSFWIAYRSGIDF